MTALIVDGGGTKTHAWLVDSDSGSVLREFNTGPSNISTIGEAGLREVLSALASEFASSTPAVAVFGLAGVGRPHEASRARAIAADLFPAAKVIVMPDAHLAYAGAFAHGRNGILLIAGTGTIALYQNPAGLEFFRAGGWGPLLGDEGGGNWLGREALRHCLFEWEHGELSPFHEEILRALGAETSEEILTKVYHEGFGPGKWATLAPVLFKFAKNDSGAMRILRRAAMRLIALAERLMEDLPQGDASLPLVILGGLWEQRELLEPLMRDEIDARNLPLVISRPDGGPLEGGLAVLRRLSH